MGLESLKETVWRANMGLVKAGLVKMTWGNASGVDRQAGMMVIKPSGAQYDNLRPEDMVVVSLETGQALEGPWRPSSDAPSHRILYQRFEGIGGIIHTHSAYATGFAQALREIPCLGTTHADSFYGAIPLTRQLTPEEIKNEYEINTGKVIVECFESRGLSPNEIPGALVPCHGPFAWGMGPMEALENAVVLEEVARVAFRTFMLSPQAQTISQALLDKHHLRKHGPEAYYGQKNIEK